MTAEFEKCSNRCLGLSRYAFRATAAKKHSSMQ